MSNGFHGKDPESLMREAAESFTAVPGEEVWAGIELAIRKKDKRKRFVWFMILPVILIPAILLMGKPFQTKEHAANTEAEQKTTVSTENKTSTENKISPAPINTASSAPVTAQIPTAPQETVTNSNEAPVTNHQSPITSNQTPAQNIQPVMQHSKPVITAAPKTAKQFTGVNEHNNDPKSLTKRSGRTAKNKISKQPAEPEELIADVPVKQEEENTTAATPVPGVPAETIETKKQQPAETAIAQRNEPVKISEPEIEAAPLANNLPEVIKPVNRKSDALNQKPVFPTVTVELPRRKFKYGFTVSAGGGYRLLSNTAADNKRLANPLAVSVSNPGAYNKTIRDLNHRPAFVFSAGVIASLPLSQKWSLEAGVEYQMLGYNVPAYKTTPWQVNYTAGGVVVTTVSTDLNSRYVSDPGYAGTSVAGKKTLKNQYHFISVPVTAVYESNPFGKRSFYLKAGLAVSYLLNKDAYIYSAESHRYFISPNPETYRNLNVAGVLEGGVRLVLKNNNELRVGMNFSFNALPTHNSNIPLREYLYQSGIKISYLLR